MQQSTRAQRQVWLAIGAVLGILAALPVTAAYAAPPDNDDFGNAQVVRVGDRVTGTTIDATLQSGEPAPGASHSRSVWYRLTPAASETLRIDNCSGGPWAELAIFTGPGLGALTEAPLTRSGCSSGSRVYLGAVAATAYYVRVTGRDAGPDFNEASGPLVLSVARPQAPANDNFENAQPIGRPAQITGTIVDATVQPGEPAPAVFGGGSGPSVWFKLAATANSFVLASTRVGTNDPMLAVYTGSSLGSLTEVGTEGGPTGSRTTMSFITQPGTTYHIAVRSRGDGAGDGDFTLNVSAPDAPSSSPNFPAPPAPRCSPDPTLITYSGKHAAGGTVCLRVTKDGTGLAWFSGTSVPGDRCMIPWFAEVMYNLPAPIDNGRFSYGSPFVRLLGSFPANHSARGTLQVTQRPVTGPCHSAPIAWTATASGADLVAPALRLGGATVQRPLRGRRAITVLVRCHGEACVANATTRVAGVEVKAAKRTVRPSTAGRAVRLTLSSRARSALARALRAKRSVKVRVTVIARDSFGNRATARRTIRLRR